MKKLLFLVFFKICYNSFRLLIDVSLRYYFVNLVSYSLYSG